LEGDPYTIAYIFDFVWKP